MEKLWQFSARVIFVWIAGDLEVIMLDLNSGIDVCVTVSRCFPFSFYSCLDAFRHPPSPLFNAILTSTSDRH